jgi:hypothetical protein
MLLALGQRSVQAPQLGNDVDHLAHIPDLAFPDALPFPMPRRAG